MCTSLVTQLCLTLCDFMDGSPPGSSVYGDSPGKNTGVGCHALLQGIFMTQGLNPGLPHCRLILYHLSHQGNPCVYGYIYNGILLLLFSRSVVSDSETPWTVACPAPLSMGILQAGILEWVAMPSSRGSSRPRDRTCIFYISCIVR